MKHLILLLKQKGALKIKSASAAQSF